MEQEVGSEMTAVVTALGADRSRWRRVKLGEIAKVVQEFERNPLSAGFKRFLRAEHIDGLQVKNWGSLEDDYVPPTFYRVFRAGQTLYPTRSPEVARAAVPNFDGITGEKILTIVPSSDEVDPRYLPFVFHSERMVAHTTARAIGSVNKHIRWREIAEFEFDLPPLDEQGRIAEVLWEIEVCLAAYMSTENQVRQLFRCSLDSEMEPDDTWQKALISEIGQVQLGRQRSPKYQTGKYTRKYLRAGNISDGRFDLREVFEMDFDDTDFNRYSLKHGDILLTEGDLISTYNVGRSALWQEQISECCFQNTLIRFRPNGRVTSEFVAYALRKAFYDGVFARVASSTTVAHIGSDRFSKIALSFPPLEHQRELVARLQRIEENEEQIVAHVDRLKSIKRSLSCVLLG